MDICVRFRRIDGKLACFVKTVGKVYVNVDFINYLSVSHSKRRGWQVKAWCDTEHDDHFILGEFETESEAIDFGQWFVKRLNLPQEADGEEALNNFLIWRLEKLREKYGCRPNKIPLAKLLP